MLTQYIGSPSAIIIYHPKQIAMRNGIQLHSPEAATNKIISTDEFRIPMRVLNCQEQLDSPVLKSSNEQEAKHHLRKNHIKISRNKLPSDFFGSVKPASVSASLPQRTKKLVPCTTPLASKNSLRQYDMGAAHRETVNEQENQLMKLTSCFGSLNHEFSPQKRACLTDRKYHSQKDKNQSDQLCNPASSRQPSTERRKIRSIGKPKFFDSNTKHLEIKRQLQLPLINVSPLRKRISNTRKLSDDTGSAELQKKISALLTNSSLPPQAGALYKPQAEKPRHKHANTLELKVMECDQDMNVTFCSPSKKVMDFFQQ